MVFRLTDEQVARLKSMDYTPFGGMLGLMGQIQAIIPVEKIDIERVSAGIEQIILPDLGLMTQLAPCGAYPCDATDSCAGCKAPLGEDHLVYWYGVNFGVSVCNRLCAEGYEQQCADRAADMKPCDDALKHVDGTVHASYDCGWMPF